ncbi:GntR family transcriptional regulator [Nitriliruptor alkaliphilus]|uniref:GntR family transcriptional regulator n=1 Tax=Nitriliruptor alkaliphilus TaxID=427918 RepID=UPI000696F0B8|nr:GntR family transcriptional regulator [Nitriliruptor alkaliphilus]
MAKSASLGRSYRSSPSPMASLKDLAAAEIRQRIFSGDLKPGSKVDQETLAAELGMSKLPVREALISLDSEGLIHSIARRGSFVAELTREDIRDHYQIFGTVAGLAAERAATALTDDELKRLAQTLDEMESTDDPVRQEELNHEFHRVINIAGRSRRLTSVLGLLSKSLPSHFYEFHTSWSDTAHKDHRRILRALKARNADRAGRAMSDHLRRGADHAVAFLESAGFWDAED